MRFACNSSSTNIGWVLGPKILRIENPRQFFATGAHNRKKTISNFNYAEKAFRTSSENRRSNCPRSEKIRTKQTIF